MSLKQSIILINQLVSQESVIAEVKKVTQAMGVGYRADLLADYRNGVLAG